ncbi:MAG: alkaline phosphatase family protein [Actinomycetes bacterium]
MVLLAVDGLSLQVAVESLVRASVVALRSTFPSTSTTAWLTAVTGRDVSEHWAVGMVCRLPGTNYVVNLVTGERAGFLSPTSTGCPSIPESPLLRPAATIFDQAAALGVTVRVIGPELAGLRGPWADALLHGVRRPPGLCPSARPGTLAQDARTVVRRTIGEVESALAGPSETGLLLWAYVNLDDHVHRSGYDAPLEQALRDLDEAAERWAARGWTVLAHSDHGQTPVKYHQTLAARWARLDSPTYCSTPSGGAGRVRWLYPSLGREEWVAAQLRSGLEGHALVFSPDELDATGLLRMVPAIRERIGAVIAVATSPLFPVPQPHLAYEHGAITDAETLVPLATWGDVTSA